MAKKRTSNAYKKLIGLLIVLFVLVVLCGAGYMLLDQTIKAQETESQERADQENQMLEEQYRQAKAEEAAQAAAQVVEVPRPQPKQTGWDVLDLSDFPLTNTRSYQASRMELITSGMLLVNRWHAVPSDLSSAEFLVVHSTDKTIPTAGEKVKLLAPAITPWARCWPAPRRRAWSIITWRKAIAPVKARKPPTTSGPNST